MNGKTMATPSTLKAMCATATRRASAEERRLAASAVAHVPMLAPRTMGMAPSSGRSPCWASESRRPIVATDEVMPALKAAPTRSPRPALPESATSTWRASALSATGAIASVMTRMPRKTNPKPSTACPRLLTSPRRPKKESAKPAPTMSRARSWTLKARSCTVKVVPMSAPRITPSDWRKLTSPAETKPISMSVVAEEDWMTAVASAPEHTADRRVRVALVSMCRRCPPAARWSPSPQSCMP
ncbi:MAG: hypothetical protein HW381_1648 [Candidatus Rokubacteria bacterium]|nr:hypothetical protein [Candidatus Rokubacteria bacterium]